MNRFYYKIRWRDFEGSHVYSFTDSIEADCWLRKNLAKVNQETFRAYLFEDLISERVRECNEWDLEKFQEFLKSYC